MINKIQFQLKILALVSACIGVTTLGGCTTSDGVGEDDTTQPPRDSSMGGDEEETDTSAPSTDSPDEDGTYVSADAEPTPAADEPGNTAPDGDADGDTDADTDADGDTDTDENVVSRVVSGESVQVSNDGQTLFSFDPYRGFQVTDISDPSNPRRTADVSFGGTVGAMYIIGKYAYFVTAENELDASVFKSAAIEVLDIRDPASPLRVSRTVLDRGVSKSIAVQKGESSVLYVLGDGRAASYRLTTDGKAVSGDSIEMGADFVDSIHFTDDTLAAVLYTYTNADQSVGCGRPEIADVTLWLLDVTEGDGTVSDSTSIPLVSDGYWNRSYSLIPEGCLAVQDRIVTLAGNDGYVQTFDVRNFNRPTAVERSLISPDQQTTTHCLFTGERKFVATTDNGQGFIYTDTGSVTELAVDSEGKIEHISSLETTGGDERLFSVLGGSRLIGTGSGPESLGLVRLYAVEGNGAPITTAAELSFDLSIFSGVVQADGVDTLVNETAPNGTPETGLLVTSVYRDTTGLQLVTFSSTTLTKRGFIPLPEVVEGMRALDENTLMVPESRQLYMVDVRAPETPEVVSAASIAPHYMGFTVFGDTGVRQEALFDLEGELQVVAADENMDRTEPSVVLDSTYAGLLKVGDHLAVTHIIYDGTTMLEVFDFSTPSEPVSVKKIVDHSGDYDYDERFAFPEGIVFLHIYGDTTLRYLDLSDPENPELHDEIAVPLDGTVVHVFAEKSTVYINYKVPVTIENDDRPYAAHYYKAIDLTAPAAPKISDAVNIPGVLTALNDAVLYTRDTVYESGAGVVSTVNRLTLDNGVAYRDASYNLGHAAVTHMAKVADSLLVTHAEATSVFAVDTQNDLSIFDADEEMSLRGGYTQEGRLHFLAATEQTALMMRSDGAFVLDLENPAQPKEQSYLPMAPYDTQTLLQGNLAYVLNGRRIFTIDLAE